MTDENAQEGGLAKVWLCSLGAHHTMVRLGGELDMMAPTWWWSAGRRHPGACEPDTVLQHTSAVTRARQAMRCPLMVRLRPSLWRRSMARDSSFDPPGSPRADILRSRCISEAGRFT